MTCSPRVSSPSVSVPTARGGDPEPLGRAPHQQRIARRLGGREQQQSQRLFGQGLEPPSEALLDPPRKSLSARQPETARQLRCRQPPRQLQQGQRIPSRLGHDPISDLLAERKTNRRFQQSTGVFDTQPAHLQLRKPPQRLTYHARAEHEPDTFSKQPPRRKRERQRRRPIQPLRVIHDTQKGAFSRGLREQAQYRQPDQESIRRGTLSEPEHDLEGLALRSRKPL